MNCVNKTSGLPHAPNPGKLDVNPECFGRVARGFKAVLRIDVHRVTGWHVFLYNLTADRAETTDLWATQRSDAKAMLGRFLKWQASVDHSKGPEEIGCHIPPDTDDALSQ